MEKNLKTDAGKKYSRLKHLNRQTSSGKNSKE